jgi:hypothetical protein
MNKNNELTVVNSDNGIYGIINNPDNYSQNELNQIAYNQMSGYLENDRIKKAIVAGEERLRKDVHEEDLRLMINFEEEFEDFLSSQISEYTEKSYRVNITKFLKYCEENNLDPLKITVKNTREYLLYLREKYVSRSIRTIYNSVSSFYGKLHRDHFDVIKINPFLKNKLPKIIDKFEKDYITDRDYNVFFEELKQRGKPEYLCCIKFLWRTGKRVGIFRKMKIHENLTWNSESKGKEEKGILTKTEYNDFIKYKVQSIDSAIFSSFVKKITNKLKKENKISCNFSVHDIRRAVMKRMILNCKTIQELIMVSREFHKDIRTTIAYFESFYDKKLSDLM